MAGEDLFSAFDKRLQRRLSEMAEAAGGVFATIDADCVRRGIYHSGMRIQRQIGAVEAELKKSLDWAFNEASSFSEKADIERGPLGQLLLTNLRRHLYVLFDSVRWSDEVRMMQGSKEAAVQRALSLLDGDVTEFQAGIWNPRNHSSGGPMNSTTNNSVVIQGTNHGVVQQSGANSTQIARVDEVDTAIKGLLDALHATAIEESLKQEIRAEVETIRVQIGRSVPNRSVLQAAGEGLKQLTFGIAGNLLTPPVMTLLAAIGLR